MRTLDRNKKYVYYANLIEGEDIEVYDPNGNATGEFIPCYGDVEEVLICEGVEIGVVQTEQQGRGSSFTKTLCADTNCPIQKYARLWVGFGKVENFNLQSPPPVDSIVRTNGGVFRFLGFVNDIPNFKSVPHNCIVVDYSKSLNSITYTIREVNVNV